MNDRRRLPWVIAVVLITGMIAVWVMSDGSGLDQASSVKALNGATAVVSQLQGKTHTRPEVSEGGSGRQQPSVLLLLVQDSHGAKMSNGSVTWGNHSLKTDASGACPIPVGDIEPGQHVEVRVPGFRLAIAGLTKEDLNIGTKLVVVERSVSLAGTTIDHIGSPVAEVDVAVYDGRFADLRPDALLSRAVTGADGRFLIPLPQSGDVYVVPRRWGYVAKNVFEAGGRSEVIRITVSSDRSIEVRMFPILVSAVGLINASELPNAEIGNYCAFARDIPPAVIELSPSMEALLPDMRRHVTQIGSPFAYLGLWLGHPTAKGKPPANMPVKVEFVDGTSVILSTRIVPLATMTVSDIASHSVTLGIDTGFLELEVGYPTTLALVRESRATLWQRTLQPRPGIQRLELPTGLHYVMPSPLTLLDDRRRRREVSIEKAVVTRCEPLHEDPVAKVRIVVVDADGPVDLRPLNVKVMSAGKRMSLRGISEPEICLFLEPGDCRLTVHDAAGHLLGKLEFPATPAMEAPVVVMIR